MKRLLLVALLISAACGESSASQSVASQATQVCSAIVSLGGNDADFQTMRTTSSPEDALAAIDRMLERTRSSIEVLNAIGDGPIGVEARRLAAIEGGLLPILDKFRAGGDQAEWSAASDAYTRWYSEAVTVIGDVAPRLARLGVHCG